MPEARADQPTPSALSTVVPSSPTASYNDPVQVTEKTLLSIPTDPSVQAAPSTLRMTCPCAPTARNSDPFQTTP